MKNWKFSLTTCLANPIKLKDAFWTITPCCASRCRGQSCGRTLIKWDSCIWMDQAKETTSMYTFQAVIRKGKPNWFCFFTLWLSSRITTDAAQISLWHVYSSFASPLKPLYFGFWSSLENLAFLGNHTFSVSLDCPSVCLTYSYSYSPSRRPQSIWQRTILAVSCLFFFFFFGGIDDCWEHYTALSWYLNLCWFCMVPLGPAVRKRRRREISFPQQSCAFIRVAPIM